MPRILVVTNMWPSAADPAFGIFVAEQVAAIRRQGVRVDVAFVDGRASAWNYLRAIPRLRRVLAARRYDLIHAHYVLSGAVAWLAGARRADRPLVVTHHGIEVFEGWQAILARALTRVADRSLVISPAMAAHLDLAPDSVVPCGVDLALFRAGPQDLARRSLGLDPDRPLIAWIGADRPEKRLALARAAVERLQRDLPDAELLVVSGIPHPAIPTYLQAADALLVTSTYEGGPLVVKEALACNRPVISTDVGDVRALISAIPGCAVVDATPAALATALRSALAHGPVDGRAAVAPYAADAVARQIVDLYQDLLRPHRTQVDRAPGQRRRESLAGKRQFSHGHRLDPVGGASRGFRGGAAPGRRPTNEPEHLPLRILILRHGTYPEDPRVRREAGALVARGHSVDLVCLRDAGDLAHETIGGVRVFRLPVRHRREGAARYLWEYGAFFLGAATVAMLLHLRRRYDLVQVNTMPDALVFAALGPKLAGARVLLDFHEVVPELYASKFGVAMDHPLPRFLAHVEQAAARFADACLAVSDPCLDAYARRGAPRAKFTVVMNSADPDLFRPAITGSSAPPRPRRIVSHGTLVDRYGFDLLIRALTQLAAEPRFADVRLEILGDGEARPALERLANALCVGDRVTFGGRIPLDAMSGRLAGADAGVVANRRDAFTDLVVPTKLMEYVAMGIPAVVARTPAIEAYFDAGMVRFFQAGDAADLARALAEALSDPALGRQLAAEADRRFNQPQGWPVMAARYLAVVEGLAGSAPDGNT